MKLLRAALILACLALPHTARAALCNGYPFTLTNGQTADANQVMSNFNTILNCANTNLAQNGVNSNITSLTGLTTPLPPNEGGTGLATVPNGNLLLGAGTGSMTTSTPAAAGASKVLLQSATAANQPNVTLSWANSAISFQTLEIEVFDFIPSVSGTTLILNASSNNCVSSAGSGSYWWMENIVRTDGTTATAGAAADSSAHIGGAESTSLSYAAESVHLALYPGQAPLGLDLNYQATFWNGTLWSNGAGGALVALSGVNCVVLSSTSGNIGSGQFFLYGIRGS